MAEVEIFFLVPFLYFQYIFPEKLYKHHQHKGLIQFHLAMSEYNRCFETCMTLFFKRTIKLSTVDQAFWKLTVIHINDSKRCFYSAFCSTTAQKSKLG